MAWKRENSLNVRQSKELWKREKDGVTDVYEVLTDFGKPTDLLKLKTNIVSDIQSNVKFYSESRNEFFSNPDNLQDVTACPVCKHTSKDVEFLVEIYHARYHRCNNCSHVYLLRIPKLSAIEEFYRKSARYAQTYTNKEAAEFRLNAVDAALADHLIGKFEGVLGKKPGRVLDIGAGGGHFVEACRRKGMESAGFEFSESSINFAKEVWNVELDNRDYVSAAGDYKDYDAVTFWGLLEHVPNPLEFIKAAKSSLKADKSTMIMCRVPKWDSLSTAIQSIAPNNIVRHLDPLGHIMIYTESSLCELFRQIGYKPSSIWYYGMDVYELFMQIGHKTGSYQHLMETGDWQKDLQVYLDHFNLSDLMVLSFVPDENS